MLGCLLEEFLCSRSGSIGCLVAAAGVLKDFHRTAVGSVPPVVAAGPRNLRREGRKQEVDRPGDDRVVVHRYVARDETDPKPDSCNVASRNFM